MKESKSVVFLYKTVLGRSILKVLVRPEVSKFSRKFFTSFLSTGMIDGFIKKNQIDMKRYVIPKGGYKSFNEFFIRKLKPKYAVSCDATLRCPSDGLLTVRTISDQAVFSIKNSKYRVSTLLNDRELAKEYNGGTALIFRLTPSHYHRYSYCASGQVTGSKKIDGILHCVRPIAVGNLPVFTQNSREYIVIDSKEHGKVIQMEIGALLIGKITNHKKNHVNETAVVGTEKGYFEYGGSTIVVLLKDKISLSDEIMNREKVGEEIPVRCGESIL